MSDVINRNTMKIYRSVNTPDFPESEFMVINGKNIPLCKDKYWKIIGDELVEISTEEKAVVDYVAPPPEPTPEQIESIRKVNITSEIEKTYSLTDELQIIRKALVELLPDDTDVRAWDIAVKAAKIKFPKT